MLGKDELQRSPGVNLDDRLRLVPGFSLFRRSSSLVANPTTQGVSLRGLGSTGASRTLVLWDGVPLNDPFGGWVYWTRIAPEEIERTEVARGATTSVFGDRAMGGSVGLFSRPVDTRRFSASYEGGNRNTHQAAISGVQTLGRWSLSGQGRAFSTDGYFIVPDSTRGKVDTEANVRFVSGSVRADYRSLFLRADVLAEERANGTQVQQNSTSLGAISAHYAHENLSALVFHSREQFHSSFSAISADRNTERLTMLQTVPAEATGGAAFWNWKSLIVGGDAVRTEGYSHEQSFPSGYREPGGVQNQGGIFAQANHALGPVRFIGGLRHQWAGGGNRAWMPSGGLRWRQFRASAYRGFRAPTLNELYREFRVGNVVTQANAALRPEILRGVEAGWDGRFERLRISATAFYSSLDDLITNVTLRTTPTLITRQRQNAAAATVRGGEAEITYSRGPWSGQLSYLFSDARYATGLRIPQVPRHQGAAQLGWAWRKLTLSGGLRTLSAQFEDDLNTFLLPGFAVVHLSAHQPIARGVTAFAAFENLLDRQFVVGYSPTPLIGAPRLWRAGLRWERAPRRP